MVKKEVSLKADSDRAVRNAANQQRSYLYMHNAIIANAEQSIILKRRGPGGGGGDSPVGNIK